MNVANLPLPLIAGRDGAGSHESTTTASTLRGGFVARLLRSRQIMQLSKPSLISTVPGTSSVLEN